MCALPALSSTACSNLLSQKVFQVVASGTSPPDFSVRFTTPAPLSGILEAKWAREVKLASKVEGVNAEKSWVLSRAVSILVVLRIDIFTRTAVLAEMKLIEMSTAPRDVRRCLEALGFKD